MMAFNQFAALDDFENCIWNNEFPSDQILDRMMALTLPLEVCITYFVYLFFTNNRLLRNRCSYSFAETIFSLYCSGLYSINLQVHRFCFFLQGIEHLLASEVQSGTGRKRPAEVTLIDLSILLGL